MNDFNLRKFLVENKLTPQSLLNESEDSEYSVSEPSPEWGARELTVYNEISIDDFKPETANSFRTWAKWFKNQPPYIDVLENGLTISRIDFKSKIFTVHINGTNKFITYNFSELDPNKVILVSESIVEQDDYEEFTIDSPSEEWDIKELTVGDTITPDMWIVTNKLRVMYPQIYESNFTITKINLKNKEFWANNNKGFFSKLINKDEWFSSQWINPNKAILIEPLTEQDEDEFTVEPSGEWNAQELTVGSVVTPDMWGEEVKKDPNNLLTPWSARALKEPVTITNIEYDSEVFYTRDNSGEFNNTAQWYFDELNPSKAYILPFEEINESDEDEFDVTPSKEWGAKELTIGDIVTPDMWTEEAKKDPMNLERKHNLKAFSQDVIIKNIWDNNTFLTVEKGDEGLETMSQWYFDELDPTKAIIVPESITEQDEDEFTVEPSGEWGAKELTIGDVITPDMWTEEAKNDYPNVNFQKYYIAFSQNVVIKQILDDGYTFTTVPENDEDGEMVQWYSDELDPTKAYIKGSEQDPNLFEQDEDEFTVEPSEEWGAQELTVGSTITPDMWTEKAKNSEYNNSHIYNKIALMEPVKIIEIESDRGNDEDFVIMAQDKNGNRSYWSYRELDHTKAYIAPESITEQDEDDFSEPIEASPEWGAKELTIGSRVTPDMWSKEAYDYFSKRGPKWILKPEVNAVIYEIEEDGNNVIWIKLLLKPKKENPKTRFLTVTHWLNSEQLNNVHIVPEFLPEQNEDDFDNPIEASPEWGAQELTVGSTITPDMWAKNEIMMKTFPELFKNSFKITKTDDEDGYGFYINKKVNGKYGTSSWKADYFSFDDLDPTKAYIVPQN